MAHLLFILPGNREDLIGRTTRKLIEYNYSLFLLISTSANTRVDQDGIHDVKEENYDNAAISNAYDSKSVSYVYKESVDALLSYEETEER